jgi:hypothetical protein
MPSVTQPWTHDLSFMQQTVLLTAIRGPDGVRKYDPPKMLLRWFRRCILISALDNEIFRDPITKKGGSFTGPSFTEEEYDKFKFYTPVEQQDSFLKYWNTVCEETEGSNILRGGAWHVPMWLLVGDYLRDGDAIPHHFRMHFLHAVEILGYKHSELAIRLWWRCVYRRLVDDLHLNPETEEQMDRRLGDNRENWLARGDVATTR